jgi:hypothetical protein
MLGFRRHSTCSGDTADRMPCSQLVAAIAIAMPSIISERALGRPGRSGRILQSGAEHVSAKALVFACPRLENQ